MISNPTDMSAFLNRIIREPDWDPGSESYGTHYHAINRIMVESGDKIEGNLFTGSVATDKPLDALRGKRRNYALFASSGNSLLEIGFNAGHSAMLALTVNPNLKVDTVDIAHHRYTRECYNYLRSVFGNRLTLHIGDSRDILPVLRREGRSYDLYHIDGGHGFSVAQADICNVLDFGTVGAALLFDDTHVDLIDALCEYYELRGDLSRIKLGRLWSPTPNWSHAIFRIHPRKHSKA